MTRKFKVLLKRKTNFLASFFESKYSNYTNTRRMNTRLIWIAGFVVFGFRMASKTCCYQTIQSGQVTYNKMPLKCGRALFTSFTFCNNIGSYSLRLNTRIYICIHSSIFYLLELAVMINLHKYRLDDIKILNFLRTNYRYIIYS